MNNYEKTELREALLKILTSSMSLKYSVEGLRLKTRNFFDFTATERDYIDALSFLQGLGYIREITCGVCGTCFQATSIGVLAYERAEQMCGHVFARAAETAKKKADEAVPVYVLEPCPFCGWKKQHVKTDEMDDESWFVECCNCHASGPRWCNTEHAVDLWSARSKAEFDQTFTKRMRKS